MHQRTTFKKKQQSGVLPGLFPLPSFPVIIIHIKEFEKFRDSPTDTPNILPEYYRSSNGPRTLVKTPACFPLGNSHSSALVKTFNLPTKLRIELV